MSLSDFLTHLDGLVAEAQTDFEVAADAEVAARLLAAFGGDLRDDAGHIDRRELGRRAFRTAEGSRRLEEIMRPPLAEAIECWLAAAEGVAAAAIVVFDAPLIFLSGTPSTVNDGSGSKSQNTTLGR